jgi:hypothetical protein
MERNDALELCGRWLPLWTGNRPDELVKIYSPDAFYRDPAKPDGIKGREALLAYFRKLLAASPDWIWTADDVFPIEGGFCLRWKAEIPVGNKIIRETGMDLVYVKDGLVTRNEVYFDRAGLLSAMGEAASKR